MYFKSLRTSQWIKNILIFIPLFTGGTVNFENFLSLFYVLIGFSLVVSSTYVYNDFKDIETDKNHPTKKNRPIASGSIGRVSGNIFMFLLFIVGNTILFITNERLIVYSLIYITITISYSEKLKYIKYSDIVSVSILFVLRVLLGSEAASVPTSVPLLLFVFFTSLGIAAGKKLSIIYNTEITESKVKNYLRQAYTDSELVNIIQSSFQLSIITYIVWIIFIKSLFLDTLPSVFLVISSVFLFIFHNIFISKTKKGLTEEIIETTKNSRDLLITIFLFGITSGLGVML